MKALFISSLVALAFNACLASTSTKKDAWPLFVDYYVPHVSQSEVGEPLYLSPYIDSGDISTARLLSEVTEPLEGLPPGSQPQSYSGLITVNEATDSHMFFWFFPCSCDVNPENAPVSVWLQGGPGSSSMFGLLEINGPFSAVFDSSGDTIIEENPYSWNKRAHMIYIDNPVGTGFSHTNTFVTNQDEVARDLYNMINQWFLLFPEYQQNDFFVFGESYAGKYVPSFSRKIDEENANNPELFINLKGLAVGNGAMDPPNSFIYAEYLFQAAVVDEIGRDRMLDNEEQFRRYVDQGDNTRAWQEWSNEINYLTNVAGCGNTLDWTLCDPPAEENNYAAFLNKESTRRAIHVGDIQFGGQSSAVYSNLIDDIPRSMKDTVEYLLERYPVMFYNGNLDIVCHHTGILEMFNNMENWSAIDAYQQAQKEVYRVNGLNAGYLTQVQNLYLIAMRNAGHMVPRSQPEFAFQLFSDFISGSL